MILSKVLSKYQITIPKEVVHLLHIHKGDFLKCEVQKDKIVFAPVVVEETYTQEELKKFVKLYKDPKNKGKVFHDVKDALNYLKTL